ncbi:MAG: hypothetical protein B7Y97_04795 [Sphingomonas sp. 32-66-10]|nr:MAG: hypothetical protein B7Y97_04795 [Sphingomonas sp. 32-66-10]
MICSMIAPALLAAACAELPPQPVTAGVRLHHWTRTGPLRLRADKVVEDSRCPMNARCIHAGRAIVRVTIRDGRKPRSLDLTLGEPARVGGWTVTLVAVSPEKMAGQQRPPAPYRFAFQVSR